MKITNKGLIWAWIVAAIIAAIWCWPVNFALSLILGMAIILAIIFNLTFDKLK